MSATDLSTPTPLPGASATAPQPRSAPAPRSGIAGTWVRVIVVSVLLLGSAGVRALQTDRIESSIQAIRKRPKVELASLPMDMGSWKGITTDLDPIIARATGADQIVTRRFVNQETGVSLEVILLYGPAVEMYIHAPELCYPQAGFALVDGPDDRTIKAGTSEFPFRSLLYSRGEGAQADLQEVYYSWWYNGHWTPNVGLQKQFERIPGMYKVHLARRIIPGEKRRIGNPCESFLQELLPEIERQMSTNQSPPSPS